MGELTEEQLRAALERQSTAILSVVRDDLSAIRTLLAANRETLEGHTRSLDAIAGHLLVWDSERAAIGNALSRHEDWIKQLARRLDLKLDDAT